MAGLGGCEVEDEVREGGHSRWRLIRTLEASGGHWTMLFLGKRWEDWESWEAGWA